MGRLAPFGSRNTRFRSVPVSCSPRTGAAGSAPRLEPAFHVPELVDVRDHQRRAGPSRAAKKADAVVNISFARLNHPTTLVIIQQRESAPDSADQFHCLATPTHSFIARTM